MIHDTLGEGLNKMSHEHSLLIAFIGEKACLKNQN